MSALYGADSADIAGYAEWKVGRLPSLQRVKTRLPRNIC